MTDREKAIVMAYTGAVMLTGDKLGIYYQYVQEKLGYCIMTHELAFTEVRDAIKDAARDDFIALGTDTNALDNNGWISAKENPPKECVHFFAAVRSLREEREPWVIEGYYIPSLPYPWGTWPILVSGDAEVYAWMPKVFPKPPKEE